MFSTRRVINPTKLNAADSHILYLLLKQQQEEDAPVLYADKDYQLKLTGSKKTLTINVTHRLIYRQNEKGEARYSVLSNGNIDKLGAGAFGTVYRLAGTLAIRNQGMVFKDNKNRVIKIQDHEALRPEYPQSFEMATVEEQISRLVPYLNAKNQTVEYDGEDRPRISYLVMDEVKGEQIISIIKNDIIHPSLQSIQKRLQITINLLRALEEIHDLQLAHIDNSSSNIMVNMETGSARFIDFGFGEQIVSPDDYRQQYDIYEIGKILKLLWAPVLDHNSIYKSQFSPDNMQKVRGALTGLANSLAKKRWTLQNAIEVFSRICLDMKINNCDFKNTNRNVSQLNLDLTIALKTYNKLRKIAKGGMVKLDALQSTLCSSVDKISEADGALDIFIETLAIQALQGLISKDAIKDKTQEVIQNFQRNFERLKNLHIEMKNVISEFNIVQQQFPAIALRLRIAKLKLENAVHGMEVILSKHEKVPTTLDNIFKLNNRYEKELLNANAALTPLETALRIAQSYSDIGSKLSAIDLSDDYLDRLKNGVREAISSYINSTFTISNYKKTDRSASARRCKDMAEILEITNSTPDQETLHVALKNRLSQIQTGFFGRSKLRANIKNVLKSSLKEAKRPRI